MTAPTQLRIVANASARPGTELLAPGGAAWRGIAETSVPLAPTPLAAQPSAYVQAARAGRPHGGVGTLAVAAAVADGALYLRLRWACPNPRPAITDNNVFADACAVMFPLDGLTAELATMGSPTAPVQAWHWRAGTAQPFVLTAEGLGTTTRLAHHPVTVAAEWARDAWSVVFRRALDGQGVPLWSGKTVPAAFAVWQGANEERAGLASHTPAWTELQIST